MLHYLWSDPLCPIGGDSEDPKIVGKRDGVGGLASGWSKEEWGGRAQGRRQYPPFLHNSQPMWHYLEVATELPPQPQPGWELPPSFMHPAGNFLNSEDMPDPVLCAEVSRN